MAGRCGCASDQCSCFISAGENTTVSGSGTRNDPYVVSAATVVLTDEGIPPSTGDPRFIGEIIEYGGASAPSVDYLPLDGRALNRSVYSTLFARLGTAYGAGDGSTTFNIPAGGKMSMSPDGSHPRGQSGGTESATIGTANLPAHTHSINHTHAATATGGSHDHLLNRSANTGAQIGNIPESTGITDQTSRGAIQPDGVHSHTIPAFTGTSGSAGTGTPLSTISPYVVIPKYIRVQGGP